MTKASPCLPKERFRASRATGSNFLARRRIGSSFGSSTGLNIGGGTKGSASRFMTGVATSASRTSGRNKRCRSIAAVNAPNWALKAGRYPFMCGNPSLLRTALTFLCLNSIDPWLRPVVVFMF